MIFFAIIAGAGRALHLNSKDEVDLIKRIKNRDEQALELFYDKYNKLIFSLVLSIVKRREEAEDVLQELFTKIWEKAHTYNENQGSVYSWVVTMSRNKAIDRIRSRRYKSEQKESTNSESPYEDFEADVQNPLEQTILNERAGYVKEALNSIPKEQRQVIMVAYFQGMTQSEISVELDLPLGTVKSRMRDGMMKLKNILQDSIN